MPESPAEPSRAGTCGDLRVVGTGGGSFPAGMSDEDARGRGADGAVTLLTRGSALALRQADESARVLAAGFGGTGRVARKIVETTGDRQQAWVLEKTGGKGLFTGELERELLAGGGDIAVHSAKDLPTDCATGLALAGFLRRANPADVLVRRRDTPSPARIATGSPRRRAQAAAFFPNAVFCELRGNVETRLAKIADGRAGADATFLAAAGLARLGISSWDGLVFEEWGVGRMVPAAGQGAIAWQTRAADAARFGVFCDAATTLAARVERAFLAAFGEGCHSAFAAHWRDGRLWLFHEKFGRRELNFPATGGEEDAVLGERARGVVREIGV